MLKNFLKDFFKEKFVNLNRAQQRKIDLIVKLNGCRIDGDEVAEVLSSNSASFVKFMSRDDSFLLHCLTACIDTGCTSEESISLIRAIKWLKGCVISPSEEARTWNHAN